MPPPRRRSSTPHPASDAGPSDRLSGTAAPGRGLRQRDPCAANRPGANPRLSGDTGRGPARLQNAVLRRLRCWRSVLVQAGVPAPVTGTMRSRAARSGDGLGACLVVDAPPQVGMTPADLAPMVVRMTEERDAVTDMREFPDSVRDETASVGRRAAVRAEAKLISID